MHHVVGLLHLIKLLIISKEYPLTKKIITNTKFPRSIIAVKKYVNYIKEYELLKELRPNNIHECSYCGGGSGMDNFFSDLCKDCKDDSCVKCKIDLLCDSIPLDLDGNIPIIFRHACKIFGKNKYRQLYQKWCYQCTNKDLSTRLIQYYWKQYKNKQKNWQNKVIYEFTNKIINYNCNKGALFHALSDSNKIDVQTVAKMQSVINIYS